MGTFAKNIMIGIFVIVAVALIVFILLFLHPTVGDNAKILKVRFTNIDKITLGTRVTYAGKPVGEVIDIRELSDARTDRVAKNGDVYVYELTLNVDSGVSVYNTDTLTIFTSGLLGEKGVEINPEPLKKGEKLVLVESEILYAVPARSLDDTLHQFEAVTKKLVIVLENIDNTIDEFRVEGIVKETGKAIKEAGEVIHHVHQIVEVLNKPNQWARIMDQLDETLTHFNDLSRRANDTWENIDKTVLNVRDFTSQANVLINQVAEGKGTVGRLIMHDDLYLRFKSIFNKAETVMKDINRYGILYQNNKRWQRESAWRRNLLAKLSDPDAFANYFNREIEVVSHSLSEVSELLNEGAVYPENLIDNDKYSKRYAELLHRVDELQDSLKMYNQQIIDLNSMEPCR
jgi:phospholipid/cholesterol/gamma-HCH transport system substrate-binding protein